MLFQLALKPQQKDEDTHTMVKVYQHSVIKSKCWNKVKYTIIECKQTLAEKKKGLAGDAVLRTLLEAFMAYYWNYEQ